MSVAPALHWFPIDPDWRDRLRAWMSTDGTAWHEAVELAKVRLDFLQTNLLDRAIQQVVGSGPPRGLSTKPVRLAILGSSTFAHLGPGIRTAGVRRGFWIETYENEFGQYRQELLDPKSALHAFSPTAFLFSFDATHFLGETGEIATRADADARVDEACDLIRSSWALARRLGSGQIIQQTFLPTPPPVMGSNDQRVPGSKRALLVQMNIALRAMADQEGVDLLALDDWALQFGLASFYSPALWHRSKQEIMPSAAPFYGDLVARLLAAYQGRSSKCLVLDLDNTLWGGVVGDDGLEGLVLGQGSPLGEGFVAVQEYARELSRRGIILAVCSKNDESNAMEPFHRHPEMRLKASDISSFAINWGNKADNIRQIAASLSIGLDSLVFVDDNPMERDLVRRELPMVAVPEVPEDPALVPQCLAQAGYFEGLSFTAEDRERTSQYASNREREQLKVEATDLPAYLRGLQMKLMCQPFDRVGLKRITQLINKTNQFNLTTRRYGEDEVAAVMIDPRCLSLQLRLLDKFGDNGIIAIVIGKLDGSDLLIDTWLMSCRVLGRQVESTTLNLLAEAGRRMGAQSLIGEYIPSPKNGMVRQHYDDLGFTRSSLEPDGTTRYRLDLRHFMSTESFIEVVVEDSEVVS